MPLSSITIIHKKQYGQNVYHPVCEQAKRFALIAGTKTLTVQALRTIKEMGIDVVVQSEAAGI